ncbi:hypothetical protein CesoFtcFv8_025667 [Champsocephalus esox]|uniref:Uncharacterized protein n=1 Tax=Champsocephalus esox TaxID=159716 RepID=A0AAN8B1G1_9TELE|nr:hypothetical protein CesoFtcFv8_025667 [Champsocephalus esox]
MTHGVLVRINLNALPAISMEDSVYDSIDDTQDPTTTTDTFPEKANVWVEDDIIGHPASIVYHDSVHQLAKYLVVPVNMCTTKDPTTNFECRAPGPFEISVKSRGTAAIVEWMCLHGHTVWTWCSQPTLKYGMLVGDFMLASNILLSGNNYAKISLLFRFMNMGMVERSSFFRIYDYYCVDSIKDFWNEKRAKLITQLHPKGPVVILGDARMDSPGFCVHYCTYTAMDNDSKNIICMVNIDKRETQRNSVIMEKEGFVHTMNTLREELHVTEMCTDAHTQILALFSKGDLKDSGIHHSLDIWHGSRDLGKKVLTAGQQKGCSILQMWNKDICNHFWYCCKTADHYEDFFDMWIGLLHHVTGEHSWALGACHHGPLLESREKEWLKNVHKYLRFRSTADLESFNNHILIEATD